MENKSLEKTNSGEIEKSLEKQIEERKMQLEKIDNKNSLSNIFSKKEDKNIKEEPKKDYGGELVEQA